MKIKNLIAQLSSIMVDHGDIEVTVTGSHLPDGFSSQDMPEMPDVFESTCENLIVLNEPKGSLKKRVRLYF